MTCRGSRYRMSGSYVRGTLMVMGSTSFETKNNLNYI